LGDVYTPAHVEKALPQRQNAQLAKHRFYLAIQWFQLGITKIYNH